MEVLKVIAAPRAREAARPRFASDEERRKHREMMLRQRLYPLAQKRCLDTGLPLPPEKIVSQISDSAFIRIKITLNSLKGVRKNENYY